MSDTVIVGTFVSHGLSKLDTPHPGWQRYDSIVFETDSGQTVVAQNIDVTHLVAPTFFIGVKGRFCIQKVLLSRTLIAAQVGDNFFGYLPKNKKAQLGFTGKDVTII